MTARIDRTNHRFGRWTAIQFESHNGRSSWRCRCDCGTVRVVSTPTLTSGASQSCGCLHKEIIATTLLIDITGQRFGRLTVQSKAGYKGGRILWSCYCDCGGEALALADNLKRGHTQSCGCFQKDQARISGAQSVRHGESSGKKQTTEYRSWTSMISRCTNKNLGAMWGDYGGRGITVCERWRSYPNFLADMGRKPTPSHTIDRKDVNGNYEPGNCRWATKKEQVANRRPFKVTRIESFSDGELLKELQRRGYVTPKRKRAILWT